MPTWSASITELTDGGARHFSLLTGNQPLSWSESIGLWGSSQAFRSYFVKLLNDAPLDAYRWETPPINRDSTGQPFEFVLLPCPSLVRTVDPDAFRQHFRSGQDVVTFLNLGRDANLVVPCPVGEIDCYGHLASFLRRAPEQQVHRLWMAVAEAMKSRIGDPPVWLSTAGMGVAWLHVRLDDRPKYYGHAPYRLMKP